MRKYVIFGEPNDFYEASYKDISEVEGAIYQSEFLPGMPKLVKKIHTAHCLIPFSAKRKIPLKRIWYKKYFSQRYKEGDEYVFVFLFMWNPIFHNGYLEYLRKNYPNCKCVLFLCDINCAKKLNIEDEKKRFDHIMVFERFFAKENDIEYYPLVYSDYREDVNIEEKTTDLLFVGWAKGRYKLLKQIYDRLSSNGVKCQFYLTKMDEEIPKDSGIHFVDWVPYDKYIELLKKAKCLLDIVPPNTDCSTLRANEAMSYKSRILTNNTRIVFEEFYDPESISVYNSPDEIDINFLLREYTNTEYNGYIKNMGPAALVRHLDKIFFDKGDK